MNNIRIAVVGVGPAGLTALKALREEGFDVVGFDQPVPVGWQNSFALDPTHGPASQPIASTRKVSKFVCGFSDFPIPREYPPFLTSSYVSEYLQAYARHFQLEQHIRFRTTVRKVLRDKVATGWTVHITGPDGDSVAHFDKIVFGNCYSKFEMDAAFSCTSQLLDFSVMPELEMDGASGLPLVTAIQAMRNTQVPHLPRLHHMLFPPRWASSIAFLSWLAPQEPVWTTYELASLAVAQVWAAETARELNIDYAPAGYRKAALLPSLADMNAEVDKYHTWLRNEWAKMSSIPPGSIRSHAFYRGLHQLAGTGMEDTTSHLLSWRRWRLRWEDGDLYNWLFKGPANSYAWRLIETNPKGIPGRGRPARPEARENVEKAYEQYQTYQQDIKDDKLRQTLRDFDEETPQISPRDDRHRSPRNTPERPIRGAYDSFERWISTSIMNAVCPPRKGYQRITFTCGCGEIRHIDARELLPGAMRAFERELRSAASTARQHAAGYTESTSSLQVPQPARLAHDQRSDTAMGQSDTTARVPRQSVAGSSSESIQRRERPTRYLLLCVNVKSLTELVHIDVASYQNDQYLFDAIRKEYERIRERTTWNPFMLVSTYVPTPVWMRLPTWAVWLGRAHVEAPRSAVFVRLCLTPKRTKISPSITHAPDIPPPKEVEELRYHYNPCPMGVDLDSIDLHELLKPGPHLDDFWLNLFPKKLNSQLLYRRGDQLIVGWGLRINEGWNWTLLFAQFLCLLIGTVVGVLLYGLLLKDVSSAASLGSLFVAIVVSAVTLEYWRRNE